MADEKQYPPAYPGRGTKKYFKEDEPETRMDRLKGVGKTMMQGINQGLVGSAFESFGKAFENDGNYANGRRPDLSAGMDNWRQMGQNTQNALQHRWHQAEFKQFKEEYLDAFEAQAKQMGDQASYLSKELDQLRWPAPGGEGEPRMFDPENEADQMAMFRLRSQLEKDTIMKITDMTIELSNKAAAKYGKNPLVDGMISQLYQHGAKMGMQQFQPAAGTAAQQNQEGQMRGQNAEIAYKQSLTRKANQEAGAQKTKIKSIAEGLSVHGAEGFGPWLNGSIEGQALMEAGMPAAQAQVTADAEFIWRDRQRISQNATLSEKEQNMLNQELARSSGEILSRSQKLVVKRALTKQQFDALQKGTVVNNETGEEVPGQWSDMKPKEKTPLVDNTKAMGPKEIKEKSDDWNAIASNVMIEEMLEKPDEYPTLEAGITWVMGEWLEKSIAGYNGDPNLEGLTADPKAPATREYLEVVYKRMAEYLAKKGATGPGTAGLTDAQKGTSKGKGRPQGGLGRAVAGLFSDNVSSPYKESLQDEVLTPLGQRRDARREAEAKERNK